MFFNEHDICQVVQTVWELVLRWPALPSADDTMPEALDRVLAGTVHVSGTWNGTITLFCLPELAREAAGIMYATEPSALPSADINDALGELTNMVGGNVRSLLPDPCQLSLPQVYSDCDISAMRQHIFMVLRFVANGHQFWVVLSHGATRPTTR